MKRQEPPRQLPELLHFQPLQLHLHTCAAQNGNPPTSPLDAIMEMVWGTLSFQFGVEYSRQSTPQIFEMATNQALQHAQRYNVHPLVVVPFLAEERLRELERRSISGIDLCGNGIVMVPNTLFVFRTGAPNRFTSSTPIRNVYRGNTSLVARVFLLRPEYRNVIDVHNEIKQRGGSIVLSTVSKALKGLEEDLVIGRKRGTIRLLQAEKLLDRLAENFVRPRIRQSFLGKAAVPLDTLASALKDAAERQNVRVVATGLGSVGRYAVMARERMLSLYCTHVERLRVQLPLQEDTTFPNLQLLESEDATAYFDLRYQDGYPWASPLQTYLELMAGEKRERETAKQVRRRILDELVEQQR